MTAAPEMVARVAAAQATLDRFKDAPFALGKNDCARMVAFHLRKLGVAVKLAKAGSYSSALGGRRALKRLGFGSLAEAVDAHGLLRIPPAAAAVGDLLELPAEDSFGALGVALGNGRVLAYHQDATGAVVVQPLEYVAAWRVLV